MNPRTLLAMAASVLAALSWLPRQAEAQTAGAAAQDYQTGERLTPRGAEAKPASRSASRHTAAFTEIEWDDLLPPDWNPQALFDEVDLDAMDDADPRAIKLLQRLREEWDRAPVVQAMDGRRIRIPGFVVPLEGDGKTIREFLLVPYFGACIHVPPPPANQLIHVLPAKAIPGKWNMAPVWVNGELSVERTDSELGSAGYRLRAVSVEEYIDTEPLPPR